MPIRATAISSTAELTLGTIPRRIPRGSQILPARMPALEFGLFAISRRHGMSFL
jgi:hypothetical protein